MKEPDPFFEEKEDEEQLRHYQDLSSAYKEQIMELRKEIYRLREGFSPFASETKKTENLQVLHPRPCDWHCIYCGWYYTNSVNDYHCLHCDAIRPFVGGSATIKECSSCLQYNLALASYCEWCGSRF